MSVITRIDISHHQLPLDPPFPAAWDTRPRTQFPATIVRVHDDAGHVGVGSGDAMYGFADFERYFIGEDPLDLERHAAVLANIEFHAGRPWPLDVALWDLAGQIHDRPVWSLVGGRSVADPRLRVVRCPSTDARDGRPRPRRGRRWASRAEGPVRSARRSSDDLAVVRAIRDARRRLDRADGRLQPGLADAVGHRCRRGTSSAPPRSPSISPPSTCTGWRNRCTAATTRGTPNCGGAVDIRIAGGELTREPYEFRELLERDCLDVFQPDCVCTQGLTGLRRLAHDVVGAGKTFSPHTWGNGIGLLANAHLTAGTVGAPFLEFPFDPPEWTTARRDFVLTETIEVDGEGWIVLSDRPGLGCTLDERVLTATASHTATFT